MKTFKIYLIDDKQKESEQIIEKLNNFVKDYNDEDYQFEFIFLPSLLEDNKGDEEAQVFYDETIISEIERKYGQTTENERVGLLLDVLLTREDEENAGKSYYPQVGLAKDIYFKFCDKMPVYIITRIPVFATQSDVIMGTNLSEQYISRAAVLKYNLRADMKRMLEFYKGYEAKEK